jgi:hypothetical protein
MRKTKTRNVKPSEPVSSPASEETAKAPKRPAGKLGLILERLEEKHGATTDELVEATGWQKHSVLGALSRLRSQGFVMRLEAEGGRKAYRLDKAEG